MSRDYTFLATGDVGMNRQNPDSIFDGVRETLQGADLVFGQLEPCLADTGTPLPQTRLPMRGAPAGAGAIARAGYDVISFATNHCMDWGREAFYQTISVLKEAKLSVIGVGADIEEARIPVIRQVGETKVGFLGYNTILPQNYFATEDRPGCAPMRALTVYDPIEHDQPGMPCRIYTFPRKEDLDALLEDITQLRPLVDVLIVSLHWGLHFIPAELADYQRYVAHAAIDAGADLLLGHHTHSLKPVEVYKGKAIFYSLANFALDPPQAFAEHLEQSQQHREIMALNKDWKKSGRKMPEDSYMTILARIRIRDRKISEVGFLPVMLDPDSNPYLPAPDDPDYARIIRYMDDITKSQKITVHFTEEQDYIRVI